MKTNSRKLLFLATTLMSTVAFSQSVITGRVLDAETNEPLAEVEVGIVNTDNYVSTNSNGVFKIEVSKNKGEVVVETFGFETKTVPFSVSKDETINLGSIVLGESGTIEDVVYVGSGIIDIAKDRQTPVAVSTITAADIQEQLGNNELPELLNNTPSVYATKSGGGYGDVRINVRGFDQRNTAVLINGQPVNDMENGSVYWSNWAGLSDVTTAMQVQRGLGSSKLAISSVGGTINIITKSTDKKEGGAVGFTIGNDNYLKTTAAYNTGKLDNGFAASFLFGATRGDGYVQGTAFEAYNYFVGLGWESKNKNHNIGFTLTGSPQTHDQRTTSFYNAATLAEYQQYGERYNKNFGYLNGEEFNWRSNFYHKPIASLNHDWKINDKLSSSTVLYASKGRGGGTGDIGRLPGYNYASSNKFRDANGQVRFDDIVRYNQGQTGVFDGISDRNDMTADGKYYNDSKDNGLTRRASINSHDWYGVISNINYKPNENFSFDLGGDLRTYTGYHYRRVDNLLGADGYIDNDNVNMPNNLITNTYASNFGSIVNVFKSIDDEQKIDYYNEGNVKWAGLFGQVEYTSEKVSAFVQGAVSNQGFRRVDPFTYLDTDPNQTSDWQNLTGGNIKGGVNFNIDEYNNVFANAGHYSKQPGFDAIFLNYENDVNPNPRNEKVNAVEFGYGYKRGGFKANLNLYRTEWSDRFIRLSGDLQKEEDKKDGEFNPDAPVYRTIADMQGVGQLHQGAELDLKYKINSLVSLEGMFSYGDWRYTENVTAKAYEVDTQEFINTTSLYLKDVKVGDAAQTTARLGVKVKPIKNLSINANWRYADRLYAKIEADSFDDPIHDGSLRLPSFHLMDAGVGYKFKFDDTKKALQLRLNVSNVFDTSYISESLTNTHAKEGDETYDGINTSNKVFFGYGRTWNMSARFSF